MSRCPVWPGARTVCGWPRTLVQAGLPPSLREGNRASRSLPLAHNPGCAVAHFVCRFDENFSGGTNPDDWVSSLDIVQQWYDNDKTPVNYGQCWVFAALGRSLFASMGLVSRQVANPPGERASDVERLRATRVVQSMDSSGDARPRVEVLVSGELHLRSRVGWSVEGGVLERAGADKLTVRIERSLLPATRSTTRRLDAGGREGGASPARARTSGTLETSALRASLSIRCSLVARSAGLLASRPSPTSPDSVPMLIAATAAS